MKKIMLIIGAVGLLSFTPSFSQVQVEKRKAPKNESVYNQQVEQNPKAKLQKDNNSAVEKKKNVDTGTPVKARVSKDKMIKPTAQKKTEKSN